MNTSEEQVHTQVSYKVYNDWDITKFQFKTLTLSMIEEEQL